MRGVYLVNVALVFVILAVVSNRWVGSLTDPHVLLQQQQQQQREAEEDAEEVRVAPRKPTTLSSRSSSSSSAVGTAAASSTAPSNSSCNPLHKRRWRPGKCSDDAPWLIPWMRTRPHTDWVIADVGANKGYVIARYLEMLQQDLSVSVHNLTLGLFLYNRPPGDRAELCGACGECADPRGEIDPSITARSVRIYGFEPSLPTYHWLKFFFRHVPTMVNITNAAVSNIGEGTVYFPDATTLGGELGSVRTEPAEGYRRVPVTTLDHALRHERFLDILTTDAEGLDQQVAAGAHKFLSEGRVGVYQFEMQGPGDFEKIFENLYEWGYLCYFTTESRSIKRRKVPFLIRISGCWRSDFLRMRGWVNALCYNTRMPELERIFTKLESFNHTYGGPARWERHRFVSEFVRHYVKPLGGIGSRADQLWGVTKQERATTPDTLTNSKGSNHRSPHIDDDVQQKRPRRRAEDQEDDEPRSSATRGRPVGEVRWQDEDENKAPLLTTATDIARKGGNGSGGVDRDD